MERAPAPSRATASITVTFGLMSIPCAIYTGVQDTAIRRKEFVARSVTEDGKTTTELRPVGRSLVDKVDGSPVAQDEVQRLIETEGGPVEVTEEEWSALTEAAPGTADVVCFLPLSHMSAGHYVPEQMYQIKPAKTGSGKNKVEVSGKPFDLLMATMRKRGVFAIVKVTIKRGSSPKYAALMPNERLYLLHFDNEVRATITRTPNELPEQALERAAKLIDEATVKTPPPLVDEVSDRIREFAEQKASSNETPKLAEVESKTETVDDLDALLTGMGV